MLEVSTGQRVGLDQVVFRSNFGAVWDQPSKGSYSDVRATESGT